MYPHHPWDGPSNDPSVMQVRSWGGEEPRKDGELNSHVLTASLSMTVG